ncbi:chromosome segregation protein SMC, partial [mine drainage metagenome]
AKIKRDSLHERITNYEEESKAIDGDIESFGMSMPQMKFEISIVENEIENWGPVNGLAEEEFTRTKERIEEIISDTEKLKKENESLRDLMLDLEEKKKIDLLDLFRKIRDNMKKVYHVLSGGGEIELFMTDESNPLNSEVQIKAKPKGNTFSKLAALSGGEKSLTAMAF